MNFREILIAGYTSWKRAADHALDADRGFLDEAFDDWAQANWELLVERPLCNVAEFLEIYGSGSDYETQRYSRVFFHDAIPTHAIVVRAAVPVLDILSNTAIDVSEWAFDRLVARVGDWFENRPPFDHVLVERGPTAALIALSTVRFDCVRIKN